MFYLRENNFSFKKIILHIYWLQIIRLQFKNDLYEYIFFIRMYIYIYIYNFAEYKKLNKTRIYNA